MDKETFDLNHLYALYLKHVGITEAEMHPVQRIETKRAFFGACGQMLMMMLDEFTKLPDEKCSDVLQDMVNQVSNFWLDTAGRQS